MKQFKCEICGGTSIIQIDERTYECQDCGLQYDIAEVEKLIVLPQENQVKELSQGELPTDFDSVGDNQSPVEIIEQSEQEEQFEVVSDDETEEITILKPSPKIVFDDLYTKLDKNVEESNEEGITVENPGESEIGDNISILDEVSKPKISANAMAAINAFLEETEEDSNENIVEETELTEPKSTDTEETVDDLDTIDIPDDPTEETIAIENNDTEETHDNVAVAIPWFKNLKIITPVIAGVALIGVLILLFVLLPNNKSSLSNVETTSENTSVDVDSSDLLSNTTNSSSSESVSSDKTESDENANSINSVKDTDSKSSSSTSTPQASSATKGTTYEKYYYPSGQIETIYEYSNGNITQCTQYYESGNILSVEEYTNGNITKSTEYYENGNVKKQQTTIKNDSSKSICYYENGKIESVQEYQNYSLVKDIRYDENGNISQEYTYDNYGRYSGVSYIYNEDGTRNQIHEFKNSAKIKISWYENDKLNCVGEYSNDKMVKATWYDENGNVTATETY